MAEKKRRGIKVKHKISRKQAAFAYRMITEEKMLLGDVARMLGRDRVLVRDAIKREIDPNFKGQRGRRPKLSRTLTPEQYEYAKRLFESSKIMARQKAAKALAKKYKWSWHLMYYMLKDTNDYESAMKYAKEFNFSKLHNIPQFNWRKRFGEV